MPLVPFASLPDDARLWVFGAAAPLDAGAAQRLLDAADRFLDGWAAHGHPLRAAREWRDGRFLAIGVDQSTAGASGCSIDGLYRALRALEPQLGTTLLGSGRVFWRDAQGAVRSVERAEFGDVAARDRLDDATPVFDTSLTTVADWRTRFERPLRDSWHAQLVGPARRA